MQDRVFVRLATVVYRTYMSGGWKIDKVYWSLETGNKTRQTTSEFTCLGTGDFTNNESDNSKIKL